MGGGTTAFIWRIGRHQLVVYPRVGGGTPSLIVTILPIGGSIPAWAGEPIGPLASGSSSTVYPRVGGGTAAGGIAAAVTVGLSPRGRGNLPTLPVVGQRGGSIPAWAGEPAEYVRVDLTEVVYPRVGGGTAKLITKPVNIEGLSPRGRGNRQANY